MVHVSRAGPLQSGSKKDGFESNLYTSHWNYQILGSPCTQRGIEGELGSGAAFPIHGTGFPRYGGRAGRSRYEGRVVPALRLWSLRPLNRDLFADQFAPNEASARRPRNAAF